MKNNHCFVCDAWLASRIFFENICTNVFGTTQQDVCNLQNDASCGQSNIEEDFLKHVIKICFNSGILVNSYRYCPYENIKWAEHGQPMCCTSAAR